VQQVLGRAIRQKKEIKDIQMQKDVKLLLFVCNMILYVVNLKHSTKNILELMNEFGKVAIYKNVMQKSVALLYAKRANYLTWKSSKQSHVQ
jgi:hypothetical protein